MGLIKRMRKQSAVWWAETGTDHYGERTFAAPVQIKCRWEDRVGEYMNAKGETSMSKATVYVDREMNLGDYLKRGDLDSNTPGNPATDPLAMPIQAFDRIPDLKNREVLLTAHL